MNSPPLSSPHDAVPAVLALGAWVISFITLRSRPARAVLLRQSLLFGGAAALLAALSFTPLPAQIVADSTNVLADVLLIWLCGFVAIAPLTLLFLDDEERGERDRWLFFGGYTALSVLMAGFVAILARSLFAMQAVPIGAFLSLLGTACIVWLLRGRGVRRLTRNALPEQGACKCAEHEQR